MCVVKLIRKIATFRVSFEKVQKSPDHNYQLRLIL